MSNRLKITIKNQCTVLGDDSVRAAIPAFQKQVSEDFRSTWGIDATLEFATKKASVARDSYLLYLFDDADHAGALGYNDLGQDGQPLGKVFVRTTQMFGGQWSVTFSHEMLEMLADPNINLTALDEEEGRAYMYEVCDAVEADNLGYKIGDVLVSDFVLASWFEPTHVPAGQKFAFRSKVNAPFEILPGGYVGFFDLVRGGWHQITAREPSDARRLSIHGAASTFDARPRVGSRRERRRIPKSQWLRSTSA